jgi:hypothetical protein
MTASPAGHIPVFSAPTFKSFDPEDALMVDVIMPDHRAEPVLSDEELRRAEYERGLSEGDERTRHHYEALLQQERERHTRDLEEERIRFEMRESANVAAAIDGFLEITEKTSFVLGFQAADAVLEAKHNRPAGQGLRQTADTTCRGAWWNIYPDAWTGNARRSGAPAVARLERPYSGSARRPGRVGSIFR